MITIFGLIKISFIFIHEWIYKDWKSCYSLSTVLIFMLKIADKLDDGKQNEVNISKAEEKDLEDEVVGDDY